MRVTLEVVEGPGAGQTVSASTGEQITIGRTDQSDVAFPDNPEMSSTHFAVICSEQEVRLRDLQSTNRTFVNGEPVEEAVLCHGDQIKAGRAVFSVALALDARAPSEQHIPVQSAPADRPTPVPAPATPGPATGAPVGVVGAPKTAPAMTQQSPAAGSPDQSAALLAENGFLARSVPETCEEIKELSPEAKALIQPDQTPADFARALEEHELFEDAVRFLAHALCKRDAVGWGLCCVREAAGEELSPGDNEALNVVQQWLLDPGETNRRAAEKVAEELEHATPASWIAMGAFWSYGSIAPPEAPVIPPKPHLTGHAVAGGILLAAVAKEPEKAPEKYRRFIAMGIDAGSGQPVGSD